MDPIQLRNLLFGIQDSIVSTTGVLVGVAFGRVANREVLITGAVLVLAEALSMSLGSFMSEDAFLSAEAETKPGFGRVAKYALTMFVAYAATGLALLAPFALNVPGAWMWSAGLGLVGMFVLGAYVRGPGYGAAVASAGAAIAAASGLLGHVLGTRAL